MFPQIICFFINLPILKISSRLLFSLSMFWLVVIFFTYIHPPVARKFSGYYTWNIVALKSSLKLQVLLAKCISTTSSAIQHGKSPSSAFTKCARFESTIVVTINAVPSHSTMFRQTVAELCTTFLTTTSTFFLLCYENFHRTPE